jgi:hypothetical protein
MVAGKTCVVRTYGMEQPRCKLCGEEHSPCVKVVDGLTGKPRSRTDVEVARKRCVGSNLDSYPWKPREIGKDSPPAAEAEPPGPQIGKAA